MTARASKKTFEGELYVDALPVSWIRNGPLRHRPVYVLAHGAGAPQSSDFMQAVAEGLAQRGICVVRFNFPYMERAVREGKRRPPDAAKRLLKTCAALWESVIGQLPVAQRALPPVVVGGKSMGGRMMSMLVAGEHQAAEDVQPAGAPPAKAAGLVYFGYPLHPPGQPAKLRTAHLEAIRAPQLYVSGSRDSLAQLDLLQSSLEKLPGKTTLHVVDGGDHSLATSRKEPLQGSEAWLDVAATFIERCCKRRLG